MSRPRPPTQKTSTVEVNGWEQEHGLVSATPKLPRRIHQSPLKGRSGESYLDLRRWPYFRFVRQIVTDASRRILQRCRLRREWFCEQDSQTTVREAIDAYKAKIRQLAEGKAVSAEDMFSNVTHLAAQEAGRRELRQWGASGVLIKEAAQVADKLSPDHVHLLVTTVIWIGKSNVASPVALDDYQRLKPVLRAHPQWIDLMRVLPLSREIFALSGHTKAAFSVVFSHDGALIASGSTDGTVRIWHASTDVPVGRPLVGHRSVVWTVAFSPDDTQVVSGSHDNEIRIWNWETGVTVVGPIVGHTGDVNSVAFSSDGSRVVSGSEDGTIRVWDAKTGAAIAKSLGGGPTPVKSIALSRDGTRVVSGSGRIYNTVRIWDMESEAIAGRLLAGHRWPVWSVAFSPDGTRAVSGAGDRTLRVWDVATGETAVGPVEAHTSSVNTVAFSSDGSRIVSGSDDRSIRIWNAETGEAVGSLEGHRDSVMSVAFSPDGQRLVSGSVDGTVRVWEVEDLIL